MDRHSASTANSCTPPHCWTSGRVRRAGGRKVSGADRLAEYVLRLCVAAEKEDGLLSGSPEADTHKETGKYFHNNGWVVKGLRRWADLCERRQARPTTAVATVRTIARDLADDTLRD